MEHRESFLLRDEAQDTARRVRLIALAQRALRAYDLSCCQLARLRALATPDAQRLADTEARCKRHCRRYIRLEALLADATGLLPYSVYHALVRAYPCLPARLLVAPSPRRLPRPTCGSPRLFLLCRAGHKRLSQKHRRWRKDQPIPYALTCAGMGLIWPGTAGTSAKEGAVHV